jgi:hypothetical protein
MDDLSTTAPAVLEWLRVQGHGVARIRSGHVNLESVFLALTGRQLRD